MDELRMVMNQVADELLGASQDLIVAADNPLIDGWVLERARQLEKQIQEFARGVKEGREESLGLVLLEIEIYRAQIRTLSDAMKNQLARVIHTLTQQSGVKA
jgi:hypothetical protein